MQIRHFLEKDREDIRRVCLETCTDKYLCEHTEVLWAKYADYYMDNEPANIFVCVDDNDKCQGYILCSSDPEVYSNYWKNKGLDKLRVKGAFYHRFAQYYTLEESKSMAKKGYHAHMHIDISANFRRNGAGTSMVSALISYLKEKGIDGLYLGCAINNEVGTSFYKKYGFKIHHKGPGCNIFAIKLNEK